MKTMDEAIAALEQDVAWAAQRIPMDQWASDRANELRHKLVMARNRKAEGHTHEWDRHDLTPSAWAGGPDEIAQALGILLKLAPIDRIEVERRALIVFVRPGVIVKGSGDFATEAKRALNGLLGPISTFPEEIIRVMKRYNVISMTGGTWKTMPRDEVSDVHFDVGGPGSSFTTHIAHSKPSVRLTPPLPANDPLKHGMVVIYARAQGEGKRVKDLATIVQNSMKETCPEARVPELHELESIIGDGPVDREVEIRWGVIDGKLEMLWTYEKLR